MGAGEESICIKAKKISSRGFVSTEAPTVGNSNAIGQIGVHIARNREAGGSHWTKTPRNIAIVVGLLMVVESGHGRSPKSRFRAWYCTRKSRIRDSIFPTDTCSRYSTQHRSLVCSCG